MRSEKRILPNPSVYHWSLGQGIGGETIATTTTTTLFQVSGRLARAVERSACDGRAGKIGRQDTGEIGRQDTGEIWEDGLQYGGLDWRLELLIASRYDDTNIKQIYGNETLGMCLFNLGSLCIWFIPKGISWTVLYEKELF